jgi:23S rRNA (cytosine1962-C5)-methyltransferase
MGRARNLVKCVVCFVSADCASSVPKESNSSLPVVRLKAERTFIHPLIFQKSVERPRGRVLPGDVVDVEDVNGEWIGRGFFNGAAPMAVRIMTERAGEDIDEAFFRARIARAAALRRGLLNLDANTNAYRVVHAEGDGLSGLIVDRFDRTLVAVFYAAGMWKQRESVFAALKAEFPDDFIYAYADENAQKQENFQADAPRAPAPVTVHEYGALFRVPIGGKHKTGFFCDQRENRERWRQMIAAAGAHSFLDLCCNSAGFAVAAARGGATDITGVDLDEEAVAFAKSNLKLNKIDAQVTQSDIFPWLRDAIAAQKKWDGVVLDPAKMTRSRDEVVDALKKYLDMNKLAMSVVKSGGLFLTCSCTGVVSEEQFLDMIRRAAFYAHREVQILHVSGAGADHPWLANVTESRYLKAVFCRVL